METTAFHNQRFNSIQALRAICSIFIILEHVRYLNCGAFGVDVFFCISGFMIMFSTHKSTAHFLTKRAIRILPLYYFMTIGTWLLLVWFPDLFAQTKAAPAFLVKSLLFIPFDIGGGTLQPLLRIGWTVNCEIFFYLLFFVAFHISHKYRGLLCGLFLTGIVGAAWLLPLHFDPLTFYGNPIMLEFVLGIVCYYVAQKIYALSTTHSPSFLRGIFSLLLALCIFACLILTKPTINVLGFRRLIFWGLPATLIVICFFIAGLNISMPGWIVFLGNISFSVYLIHYYPVMFLDRKIFDFSTFTPVALFGTFVAVAVTIALAIPGWYLFEKKMPGKLHFLIDKKNPV